MTEEYNGSANWHTWTIESVCDNDLYDSKMEFMKKVTMPSFDITEQKVKDFIDGCEYPWDPDLSMMEVDWDEVVENWTDEWAEDLHEAKAQAKEEHGDGWYDLPIHERVLLTIEKYEEVEC